MTFLPTLYNMYVCFFLLSDLANMQYVFVFRRRFYGSLNMNTRIPRYFDYNLPYICYHLRDPDYVHRHESNSSNRQPEHAYISRTLSSHHSESKLHHDRYRFKLLIETKISLRNIQPINSEIGNVVFGRFDPLPHVNLYISYRPILSK